MVKVLVSTKVQCGSFQFKIDSLFKWVNGSYHQMVRLLKTKHLLLFSCQCVTLEDMGSHGDLDDYRKFRVMHGGMSSQGLVVDYSFVLLLSSRKKRRKKKTFGLIEQENAQIFILKTRMHSPYYAQIKLCNSERTKILEICCQISTTKQL